MGFQSVGSAPRCTMFSSRPATVCTSAEHATRSRFELPIHATGFTEESISVWIYSAQEESRWRRSDLTFDQEPENQLQELRRYTTARTWTAAEYVDKGVSGARRRRFDVLVCAGASIDSAGT
jgi:hypothetical protein